MHERAMKSIAKKKKKKNYRQLNANRSFSCRFFTEKTRRDFLPKIYNIIKIVTRYIINYNVIDVNRSS